MSLVLPINISINLQTNASVSAWVICDAKDNEGTLFLGSKVFNLVDVNKEAVQGKKVISTHKVW